ncbi:MAG: type II toxin-antitoxin system HicA family toxin [Patescibacteria group bacterium]
MTRKIRELMRILEQEGFADRGGAGSHRNYKHPSGIKVTLSGSPGDDAKHYQERDVEKAIREARRRK